MTALITLTAAGADTGPFNLYSNLDGYLVAFETGITQGALLAGYTSTLVPDYTETVRVKSTGACITQVDIPLIYPTTTTTTTVAPTTTTTTTAVPVYMYLGETTVNRASAVDACANQLTSASRYSLVPTLAEMVPGDIIYDVYPGTPTNGGNNWIALKLNSDSVFWSVQIDTIGQIVSIAVCP